MDGDNKLLYVWFCELQVWWTVCFPYTVCAITLLSHVNIYITGLAVFDFQLQSADIYDDLISRRVNSSDAEKFAEVCPCPCNGVAWGVIWWVFSSMYLFNVLKQCRFWSVLKVFVFIQTNHSCRGMISFVFLCGSMYLGLVILSWGKPTSLYGLQSFKIYVYLVRPNLIAFMGTVISWLRVWNSFRDTWLVKLLKITMVDDYLFIRSVTTYITHDFEMIMVFVKTVFAMLQIPWVYTRESLCDLPFYFKVFPGWKWNLNIEKYVENVPKCYRKLFGWSWISKPRFTS